MESQTHLDDLGPEATSGSPLRFLAGVLVAAAAMGYVAFSSFEEEVYYLTVAEAAAQVDDLGGEEFRLKGKVLPGSYELDAENLNSHTFVLEAEGEHMRVHFIGPLPDTFADEAEVIALGELEGETFEAVEVIAKCPSRYEEAPPSVNDGLEG